MKTILPNNTFTVAFDASEKTVTISGLGTSASAIVKRIVNKTDDIEIYGQSRRGSVVKDVLAETLAITLDYDTTGMSDNDVLEVLVDGQKEDLLFQILDKK